MKKYLSIVKIIRVEGLLIGGRRLCLGQLVLRAMPV